MRFDNRLILIAGLVSMKAFSWFPEYHYIDPFPFYELLDSEGNEVGISIRMFVQYLSYNVFFGCIFLYCGREHPNETFWRWLFAFEVVEAFDFWLHYNEPYFYILGYGIEYYDFKLLGYVYILMTWRRTQY
jgi:hypothetical protein